MAAGESRHIPEAVQSVAMANRALDRFTAARFDQGFPLLDAANRHVRDEPRMRIALCDARLILRQRDDAIAERLGAAFRRCVPHPSTADERLRDGGRLLHL